jgi:uncharacterized protein
LNENVLNEEQALQAHEILLPSGLMKIYNVRKQLRRLYLRKASITTKVVKSKKEEENAQKISQYFDWQNL